MEINDLLKRPLPEIPSEIEEALRVNKITGTTFEDKNEVLSDVNLQKEVGYKKLEDGIYLVSMFCKMPGITPEMIDWWFWWHPQDSLRYKVWYPGEHIAVSYHKKDKAFFLKNSLPPFKANSQFPIERIGKIKLPLRIDFISPEDFGFSVEIMKENDIPKIVCGHVGAFRGIVMHTEMAHIFRQTDDGLFMFSRFWIGKTMKNQLLRKIVITEDMAKDMAEHCCIEYRSLCEILPILYNEYKN